MDVRIEHCTVCWGYRDRALALAEEVRKRFGAKVEVVDGTLGQFDVRVDGQLIASRGESLLARIKPPRLPNVSDVIDAIERRGPSHKYLTCTMVQHQDERGWNQPPIPADYINQAQE